LWSAHDEILFVVRNVLVHGWESRESSPGVITSQPVQRWQAELVGSIELARRESLERVADELAQLIELALVGVSRLPITSVESPLPAFAFGQLGYFPVPAAADSVQRSAPLWQASLERTRRTTNMSQAVRGFEFALRSSTPDEARPIADWLMHAQSVEATSSWFRQLFEQISLAPHTRLLDNVIALLVELADPVRCGIAPAADTVSFMLRHLVRHLTAYDLVTFHSFGANYPDALWLDALLKTYLSWIERAPELFDSSQATSANEQAACRLRRRALRQAWLMRLHYEGLKVPDVPTSQGERLRVLPGPEIVVPEEQLLDPSTRRRTLFDADPLMKLAQGHVAEFLAQAWRDVERPRELLELGTATFVDRPFGLFKDPGEVDRTPLLAYEAFSARRAEERLRRAHGNGLLTTTDLERLLAQLNASEVTGRRVTDLPGTQRPGVITLEDARQASDDFVFCQTTRGSIARLASLPGGLTSDQRETLRAWGTAPDRQLLIRTAGPRDAARGLPLLTRFDARMRPTALIRVIAPGEDDPVYREAYGVEYLAGGLRFEALPND